MRKLSLFIILRPFCVCKSHGQSLEREIAWIDVYNTNYQGLLALYNNQGELMTRFYNTSEGWVWRHQLPGIFKWRNAYTRLCRQLANPHKGDSSTPRILARQVQRI